jgi:PQQ-dependent catabolism-associated CXXCW motif protein
MRGLLLMAAIYVLALAGAFAAEIEEPQGFRMEAYRAPTPAGLTGARTISTDEAKAIWEKGGAQFLDVLPATLGQGVHEGKWLPGSPRRDIPGSLWLPNVGMGQLDGRMEAYFRKALDRQPKGKPLLFYCLTDCWMSWNAAKRALSWGYGPILWYPAGTDGWDRAGLPLADVEPRPIGE